jgi:hypothetical protein
MKKNDSKINYADFISKYIKKFENINFIYWPKKGFIVWRMGTGENIELLHIKTFIPKKGLAKELIREMIKKLEKTPPYYSIFGFGLSSRENLKDIYQKLGFNVTPDMPGPYKTSLSFLFYQNYENLKKKYLN